MAVNFKQSCLILLFTPCILDTGGLTHPLYAILFQTKRNLSSVLVRKQKQNYFTYSGTQAQGL